MGIIASEMSGQTDGLPLSMWDAHSEGRDSLRGVLVENVGSLPHLFGSSEKEGRDNLAQLRKLMEMPPDAECHEAIEKILRRATIVFRHDDDNAFSVMPLVTSGNFDPFDETAEVFYGGLPSVFRIFSFDGGGFYDVSAEELLDGSFVAKFARPVVSTADCLDCMDQISSASKK